MELRAGEHLPIRTFQDRDLDADAGAAQTDPLLGVLGTMQSLSPGWRMVSQLALLEPAPVNWARAYQRLALEHRISAERAGGGARRKPLTDVLPVFGLGLAALVGLNIWNAWQRGEWLTILGLIVALLSAAIFGLGAYL